jgi:hypothetical protein
VAPLVEHADGEEQRAGGDLVGTAANRTHG